jgi:hypothetical protein
VSRPESSGPLFDCLEAVGRLLEAFGGRGVILGGVAVSLVAEPRTTLDVDAMLLLGTDDVPGLVEAAARYDLRPRVRDAVRLARRTRMVLLRHLSTGTDVDIALGMLPFEAEMVERSVEYKLGDTSIRLPTPEDLIIVKAVAHRRRDLADIESIVEAYPNLDRKRIETYVKGFAEALDSPELWDDIASLL